MAGVSRREMLKVGTAGLGVTALASPEGTGAAEPGRIAGRWDPIVEAEETITLAADDMIVSIDARRGVLTGIQRKSDKLGTNFLGNRRNSPRGAAMLTGDLALTVWKLAGPWQKADLGENVPFRPSGEWLRCSTAASGDIRTVTHDARSCTVRYRGDSAAADGLKMLGVETRFALGSDGALLWELSLENRSPDVLEVGELGCILAANDDYAEYVNIDPQPAAGKKLTESREVYAARTELQQKMIHEQKVIAHHFVSGHSSYSLLERPLGDAPFLLVQPIGDTAPECLYRDGRDGPDILALHSMATKQLRGWSKNQWINGHSSLVLVKGERRSFRFRFSLIDSYEAIRTSLVAAGNLGIRVLPSMVVQANEDVRIEVQSGEPIGRIEILSDNGVVRSSDRTGTSTLLTLAFGSRGTKPVKLHYASGRWTTLHFNCVEPYDQLIKARARFAINRQFYRNPDDPFDRHHMFMPFDYRKKNIILTSDEVWEVGGSDEPGFSTPVFLAEKNVYYPCVDEIAALELYVRDCLFRHIQNPETYDVRASLYWVERRPSSPWSEWDKDRSKETWRTYNYVHPANIYHALYRIGTYYGLIKEKSAREYLYMAYRSAAKWFETGAWRHVGLMEGSNVINILLDLEAEGMTADATELRRRMQECNKVFERQPYPYSSELLIDQTAHEQVYFFTRFFQSEAKNRKTVQVLKALRGGNQPVWFQYGQDKRRTIACWYSAALNGMALLKAFEDNSDLDALAKGYGGIVSVVSNITSDGMGFNYFDSEAGVTDYEPPNMWEGGCGLWGYLHGIKAYVVQDPAFGLTGYGCTVERKGGSTHIVPRDGLRKRVHHNPAGWTVEALAGELASLHYDAQRASWTIAIDDSTGLVRRWQLRLTAKEGAAYSVSTDDGIERIMSTTSGVLLVSAPFQKGSSVTIRTASAMSAARAQAPTHNAGPASVSST